MVGEHHQSMTPSKELVRSNPTQAKGKRTSNASTIHNDAAPHPPVQLSHGVGLALLVLLALLEVEPAVEGLRRTCSSSRDNTCERRTIHMIRTKITRSEPQSRDSQQNRCLMHLFNHPPNTSGSKKLSSAHSSCRLFWSGVPVMSRRCAVTSRRTV